MSKLYKNKEWLEQAIKKNDNNIPKTKLNRVFS